MRRLKSDFRRYRVSTRPRQRHRRLREWLAVLAILVLAGAAAGTFPRLIDGLPDLGRLASRLVPRSFVVEGAPAGMEEAFARVVARTPGTPFAKASGLEREFPFVRCAAVHYDWLDRRIRLKISMKRAVARIVRLGKPAGFLAETGEVFAAPAGLYREPVLDVDPGLAAPDELARLSRCLRSLAGAGGGAAGLMRMAYLSRAQGWEARLEDGTTVLWGDLRWPGEKMARLGAALNDARRVLQGALTADLRYFEDGKIYVRTSLASNL